VAYGLKFNDLLVTYVYLTLFLTAFHVVCIGNDCNISLYTYEKYSNTHFSG